MYNVDVISGDNFRKRLHTHIEKQGTEAVVFVQQLHSWPITLFAEAVSLLSDEIGYILLLPMALQYPQYYTLVALHVTNLMVISFGVGNQLKDRLQLPRPKKVPVLQHKLEVDFGFPSTHTSAVTLIGGFVLTSPVHLVLAIAVMAFSRMYLGVHSLTDTMGGVAYALPLLVLYTLVSPVIEFCFLHLGFMYDVVHFIISSVVVFTHPNPNNANGKSTRDWTIVCTSVAVGMQLAARYRSPVNTDILPLSEVVINYARTLITVAVVRFALKPVLKPIIPPPVVKYIIYGAIGFFTVYLVQ
eukprot:CFRG2108T1